MFDYLLNADTISSVTLFLYRELKWQDLRVISSQLWCLIKQLFVSYITDITFIQARQGNIQLAFGSSDIPWLA